MILNYTTSIAANKTVAEIQQMLSSKGARKIMVEYDPSANPASMTFECKVNDMNVSFRLPANWKGVKKAIANQKKTVAAKYKTEAHAINVSWRIIKDWVEAQMAIVEADQADIATIFLPYAIMQNGDTVAENFLYKNEGKQFLLNSGK